MPITTAQARSDIREAIDDPNAKRWGDTALDRLISRTIDGLWSDILDLFPWMVTQLHTAVPMTSPGFIDLRLTTNGGQLSQRFYRVQKVTRAGREYSPAKAQDVLIENDGEIVAPAFTYVLYGNQLWLFPLDTTFNVELRYNFLPVPYTSLTDGYEVPWPEGYDDAYIYATARRGFAKGDAESIANASDLANEAMAKLQAAIRKYYVGPQGPTGFDSGASWGSI